MSVDGTWKITVNSPMGAQESDVTLKANGTTLTGSQLAQGQSSDITGGTVDGDKVSWSNAITQPFPLTLTFNGTISGDSISGSVQAGAFGAFPFSGNRISS